MMLILLVLVWRCFGIVALHPLHGTVATGRSGIVTSCLAQPTGLTGCRGSGSDLTLPSDSWVAKLHVHHAKSRVFGEAGEIDEGRCKRLSATHGYSVRKQYFERSSTAH